MRNPCPWRTFSCYIWIVKPRRVSNLRSLRRFFVVLLLAMSTDYVVAQDCPDSGHPKIPRPVGSTCRMFGQVRLETFQSLESTSSSVRTRIQGKPGDLIPGPNATTRVLNDVLNFTLGVVAYSNFLPEEAGIDITSQSSVPFKYANDSYLTISADGKPIVAGKMEVISSTTIGERLIFRMKYSDFLVLAGSKKLSLKLGSTDIELSADVVAAMRALSEFTKQLKPAPPRVQQSCV